MTVQEIREAAKVMEAYDNGKEIQFLNEENNKWIDTPIPLFNWDKYTYRIKPEPKYRPFETKEECWQEMHKHPDFGWIKEKDTGNFVNIGYIDIQLSKGPIITLAPTENFEYSSLEVFNYYTFTDDKPFGIKEE